jgi:predicted PurR-regulated permease PerM
MRREYTAVSGKNKMDDLIPRTRSSMQRSIETIEHKNSYTIDISLKSILLVLGTLGAIYVGGQLLEIFILIFFAFIISSAALPLVKSLSLRGVPKGIAIFLVYILIMLVLAGTLTLIFVPFATESRNLVTNLPLYINNFVVSLSNFNLFGFKIDTQFIDQYLDNFVQWLSTSLSSGAGTDGIKSALDTVFSLAGGFISVITMLFMSVYMVTDHDNFVDLILLRIVDEEKRIRVRRLVIDVEEKLGSWLIGQLILCFVIGLLTWILLTIAQVPFALPLAVLAGLLESIPSIGPIISAVPATLFALIAGGPGSALIVLIGCIIIQQLENAVIVPRVMANAVGLKPIVVVIAVASGFTLSGPIGALISIPVVVLAEILFQFYQDLQKLKAKGIV